MTADDDDLRADALGQLLRSRHAGRRVLVVDDNPVNCEVALSLLENVGLEGEVAVDGAEAIECARRGGHDLVLMDVQMPGVDGHAATRAIRADPRFAALPIVAVTAHAHEDDRRAALDAGMDDHVAKPVAAHRLYAVMLRCLDTAARAVAPEAAPKAAAAVPIRPVGSPPAAAAPRATRETVATVDALAAIAGFDTAAGLRFHAGDHLAYLRSVAAFAGQAACGLDVDGVAPEALSRALHSLGGAAATVGATASAAEARRLMRGLADGRPGELATLRADAGRHATALVELAAALLAHLAAPPSPAPPAVGLGRS